MNQSNIKSGMCLVRLFYIFVAWQEVIIGYRRQMKR